MQYNLVFFEGSKATTDTHSTCHTQIQYNGLYRKNKHTHAETEWEDCVEPAIYYSCECSATVIYDES